MVTFKILSVIISHSSFSNQNTLVLKAFSKSPPLAAHAFLLFCLLCINACSPLSRELVVFAIIEAHCSLPSFFSPVIAFGAVAERAKLGPVMVLTFVWATLVYDPIACWTWNANGWSFVMGGLDFAGGTPYVNSSLDFRRQVFKISSPNIFQRPHFFRNCRIGSFSLPRKAPWLWF